MPQPCILPIYKQCVRPIFEYGIVSTITVSESVINKIQRVQNSCIRLALRLPKYVSARLLHEVSGLITVGQTTQLGCMQTPLLSIQSTRLGPTLHGTSTKHQVSYLNHQTDLMTRTTGCRKNEVISLNVQPLILKVVVRPVHGHVWHSPRT